MNVREGAGAPSDTPVLELDAVTKVFGAVIAVDRLSLRLGRGEYFCILGPSGCGKTTLLRLIAGFEVPDAGAVRIHGAAVAGVPPERRDVNVVFQQYALFPHLTVTDNVGFGLRMKRRPRSELRQRVADVLRLVRLEAEADRLPHQLSGGQQQRVALARALVNGPAALLLDEPLSALDPALRLHVREELRRIQRTTGVTFLHITHDRSEALSLADRIGVMRAGRFVQVGSPHDVYLRPASTFVAGFVGGTNLLDVRVAAGGAVLSDGSRFTVAADMADPGPAVLAIRPESLRVLPAGRAPADAPRGVIRHLAFAGAAVDCVIELRAGPTLRARLPPAAAADLDEGVACALDADPADLVVLPPDATEPAS